MAEIKYKTKQREMILNLFQDNSKRCFTSKEIIDLMQGQLGQATVYRMLSKLSAEGIISKYISENGNGALYRINNCNCKKNRDHFHLKCSCCGKLIHMDCHVLGKIAKHLEADHGFYMDNSRTVLYGKCEECAMKGEVLS